MSKQAEAKPKPTKPEAAEAAEAKTLSLDQLVAKRQATLDRVAELQAEIAATQAAGEEIVSQIIGALSALQIPLSAPVVAAKTTMKRKTGGRPPANGAGELSVSEVVDYLASRKGEKLKAKEIWAHFGGRKLTPQQRSELKATTGIQTEGTTNGLTFWID